MFSNSRKPGGSSRRTWKSPNRWFRIFFTLVLALIMGSTIQSLPAQAAPAATTIDTWLYARKLKGNQTICVGDKVVILVEVLKKVEGVEAQGGDMLGRLIGVDVQASVIDLGVGSIKPSKNMTRISSPPGRTYFTFTAENPGTARIQFWGKVNVKAFLGLEIDSNEVTTEMALKVDDCVYKVTSTSRWVQQNGTFTVVADISDSGMTMDKPGHYTGDAVVEWHIYTDIKLNGCTMDVPIIPPSNALLTGERDESNFIIDVSFDPVIFDPVNIACPQLLGSPKGVATSAFTGQPASLTHTFPDQSGGAYAEGQSFTNFPDGTIFVIVKRVAGK